MPWTHHLIVLSQTKYPGEREFYLRLTASNRWPVRELARQIASGAFARMAAGPKLSTVLREVHPEGADQFKDVYSLEFLGLSPDHSEADLHRALLRDLGRFINELGRDFCFVGSQYPVQVGNQDFAGVGAEPDGNRWNVCHYPNEFKRKARICPPPPGNRCGQDRSPAASVTSAILPRPRRRGALTAGAGRELTGCALKRKQNQSNQL